MRDLAFLGFLLALFGLGLRRPFLLVLVGILGGVETMGLLGLFVGPATMAVLVMLWREFVSAGARLPSPSARGAPPAPSASSATRPA